jgi:L-amino acid N-acyltransferase YncA
MNVNIRDFVNSDWDRVSKIYGQGLATRNATFETALPEFDVWRKKFHPHLLWSAEMDERVVGWAGLQPISPRKVYEGVVEVTIYIDLAHTGRGIGSALMSHLIRESEKAGIWTLYASIFPENDASIRLHRSSGFREIGYREKIGRLDGVWRNTLLFERRSKITGV